MNKGLLIVIALFGITTVSCVESSKKYKKLAAQRDSLLVHSASVESDYNETMAILEDIENGFAEIREKEGMVQGNLNNIEGVSTSKREQVAADVAQIQRLIVENRDKLSLLQSRLDKSGKENKSLRDAIAKMQTELSEKTDLLNTLKSDLESKNIKIEEMSGEIEELSTNIEVISDSNRQKEETIQSQDAELNEVWYCIASERELKDAGVVSSEGLFGKKKIFNKDYDANIFTKIDKREITDISTNCKKIKILSTHPKDSYVIDDENGLVTLKITSPDKFWSVSKYLVIKK